MAKSKNPTTRDQPEDMSADGKINKTGIATSPLLSREMIAGAESSVPSSSGDRMVIAQTKIEYANEAEPIGTVPPPMSLKGAAKTALDALKGKRPTVFLDKLGARLAFERTGTRLYEGVLVKFDAYGSFERGPTRDQISQFYSEEFEHFRMLREVVEKLGADSTAMTPSADIAAVESEGILRTIADPRTTFAQSLHALLLAELADEEGWDELIRLAQHLGHDDLMTKFEHAHQEEQVHLRSVREWVSEYTFANADADVVPMEAPSATHAPRSPTA